MHKKSLKHYASALRANFFSLRSSDPCLTMKCNLAAFMSPVRDLHPLGLHLVEFSLISNNNKTSL